MNQNSIRLNQAATIVAKITEVFYWVAVGLLSASFIVYFIDDTLLKYLMNIGGGEFGVAGYSIQVLNPSGGVMAKAFIPALVLGIIVCGLMAMIFRNIYLIFKTTAGKTKFSAGETPFQPAIVRMLREIGIFAFSIPIAAFLCDIIIRLIIGNDIVESSISATGAILGLAILCLSQFFAYGVQLQSDADGLV